MAPNTTTFVRDYTSLGKAREATASEADSTKLFDVLFDSEIFKKCQDALNAIPKVVVSDYKAAYDDLLSRLDQLVMRQCGKIRGVVDYDNGDAWIEVILPFLEATDNESRTLLTDVIQKSITMNIKTADDEGVRLYALLPYFEDLCDDDMKARLLDQELLKHPDVVAALEKQMDREHTKCSYLLQQESFWTKFGVFAEMLTDENTTNFIRDLEQEAREDPQKFLAMLKQMGLSLDDT